MAVDGLLSLRWNNHSSSFLKQLSFIRDKHTYSDLTLACAGKFYSVHKLVLSTCSDYFKEILDHTPCQHPTVVLQDLRPRHLEALLSYMYLGEVSVLQNELSSLIKAAECLRIKGLAVPDEVPTQLSAEPRVRPAHGWDDGVPQAKRRRQDGEDAYERRSTSQPHPEEAEEDQTSEEHREASEGNPSTPARTEEGGEGNCSPITISTPLHQQHTFQEGVIKVEENEVKYEEGDLQLPEPCGGLGGQQEASTETQCQRLAGRGEEGHAKYNSALPTSGSSDGSVLQQYPAQPQSFEEIVSQALPGPSAMQGDSGQCWEGNRGGKGELPAFHLESFGLHQDVLNPSHHTPLQQRDLVVLRMQGRGGATTQAEEGLPRVSCGALGPHQISGASGELEVVSRGSREWRCSYPDCGYVTDRESWLRQHFRKHTGEKPFSCPFCSFRSAQKGNVNVHIKRVHYGGVFPPVSTDHPSSSSAALLSTSPSSSSSSSTSSAVPKQDFLNFLKGKVQQVAKFPTSQNGVCE